MNIRVLAPGLAVTLPIVFIVILGILHILKPEIEPWWRLISEYQLGDYGWLMSVNFMVLVIGALCAMVALRPHIKSKAGWVGWWLLGVAAFGMALGGLFMTDPITTPRDQFSDHGTIHNIGGALMIFSSPMLITLISVSLWRHNPKWADIKGSLLLLSLLSVASVITFAVFAATQYRDGAASSDMLFGWPNRALILAYCIWISVVGWKSYKLAKGAA